jgi:hypothetical protein
MDIEVPDDVSLPGLIGTVGGSRHTQIWANGDGHRFA